MTNDELERSIESARASHERELNRLWDEIARIEEHLRKSVLLETSGADQRLEAAQHLAKNNLQIDRLVSSIDRLTDAFNLVRQQRDEINAAVDERERLWVHEHKGAMREHTDALIALHRQLAVDDTADRAKLERAEKIADKAAETTILAAIKTEQAADEIREITGKHRREAGEGDERDPWYARVFFKLASLPPASQLTLIFLVVALVACSVTVLVAWDRHLDHRVEAPAPAAPKTP